MNTNNMFKMARISNLIRHIRKGTLVEHLARKFGIATILRSLGFWSW